jgi:predicted NodU family carbamoyl transferase
MASTGPKALIAEEMVSSARSGARRHGPAFAGGGTPAMPGWCPYTYEDVKTMDCPVVRNDAGVIEAFLRHLSRDDVDIFFCGHHASHAARAFFSSGFDSALTITLDGIGRGYCLEEGGRTVTRAGEMVLTRSTSGSVTRCRRSSLEVVHHETRCSFGFAWARVAEHVLGLEEGAEGTAMAMAAFGEPERFRRQLDNGLLWLPTSDGDVPEPRRSELRAYFATLRAEVRTERDGFDIAAALQDVTENRLRAYLSRLVGPEDRDLCLSGGFFLTARP